MAARSNFLVALKQPTIDEHARLIGLNQIAGSGYGLRGTQKGNCVRHFSPPMPGAITSEPMLAPEPCIDPR